MSALLGVVVGVGIVAAGPLVKRNQYTVSMPPDGVLLAGIGGGQDSGISSQPRSKSHKTAPTIEDAKVAMLNARLLAKYHYAHHEIDETVSAKWFDKFIDTLDPMKLYLTQEDIQEFISYRTTIGKLVWDKGDTSPASKIFNKYLSRYDEQIAFAKEKLKSASFDFKTDEKYLVNRKDAARPKNIEESKKLWWDRLRYEYLQEKLSKKKSEEIVQTLNRRYARNMRTLHDLDFDDVFEFYLTSLAQTFDPHSTYMGKATLATFNIQMRLSLVGIGALLQSEDGYAKITELVAGGPAIRSGKMKAGDRVVAVAQGDGEPVDCIDMKIDHVVDMIRGKKGTVVSLTVIPAGSTDTSVRKVIKLVRDEVKLEEQEAKAQIVDTPDVTGKPRKIAVIDVPSFYEDANKRGMGGKSTTADVSRILKKLNQEHVDGIVLDLRRNPGGSLTEAIRLSGLFIKDGTVVQVRDGNGDVSEDTDPDPGIQYAGPLVVLTSKLSASASEILAGALQDYGRAVVVGDSSTHGKGTVQSLIQLSSILADRGEKLSTDPGALKLTIQKFYRPSGSSTQLRGVVPDIVLPSITSVADIGEDSLQNPLAWDTVATSHYKKLNWVTPYLPELKKRSDSRVMMDADYTYLRGEVARFKKLQAEKSVSLNEEARLKEKNEAEARAAAHKKELIARKEPKEKIIKLSLKQVDQPGLPAPTVGTLTAQAAPKKKAAEDPTDEEEEPAVSDLSLKEARRIVMDLIQMTTHKSPGYPK